MVANGGRQDTTCNFQIVKKSPIVNGSTGARLRTMPPAKKQRVPAPASRSAAESRAGGNGQHRQSEAQPCGLDPTAVKGFLKMIQQSDRLGPEFFTDDEKQQWDQWLDGTPASAEDSPDGRTLFPLQMPAKCLPRTSHHCAWQQCWPIVVQYQQEEIITYNNAGGRQFRRADRQRQHGQSKRLLPADLPVKSTVAIRRDTARQPGPPGYNTPFYVGDVVSVDTVDASGHVGELEIHFRMPQAGDGLFCDDLNKPWNLACHALHTYHRSCERGIACRAAAAKAGSAACAFTYKCHADEVIETKLAFNPSGTIKAEAKKRLASSAPESGAWNAQLGLRV